MAFSFFKKQPEKMVAKPAAAPRSQATNADAQALPVEEMKVAPEPVVAKLPVPEVLNDSLDFCDFQFSESPTDFHFEDDVDPIDADVEQAAVLYANGQDDAVRSLLEGAVRVHAPGPGERLWMMLFDFYRLTGQSASFEAQGIEYARAFEKSPPAWRDASKLVVVEKIAASGNLLFSGELLGANDAAFERVRQVLNKMPELRLDLSRVTRLDAAGCSRLYKLLQQANKAKREIDILGRDNMLALLEKHTLPGRAEDEACWLLLLAFLQLQGSQAVFDEAAINYAVTFEVSPPSWEQKRPKVSVQSPVKPIAVTDANWTNNAYTLCGEIKASRFADLPAFAEVHDPVLIDCSTVTRIDFISAGALLNVLTGVRRSGKQVVFHHPNYLVAALFGVVGLSAVAEIVYEKY
jgi:ABC-type transporter Mla MlaB component